MFTFFNAFTMKQLEKLRPSALAGHELHRVKGGTSTVTFTRPDGSSGSTVIAFNDGSYVRGGVMPGTAGFIVVDIVDGA